MHKLLVPCDGADNALRAIRHAANMAPPIRGGIGLLYVHDPVLLRVRRADTQGQRGSEGRRCRSGFQPARQMLEAETIPYREATRCGPPAIEIARHAHESRCGGIIKRTRGPGPIASVMIGSVTSGAAHLVDVPVTLGK